MRHLKMGTTRVILAVLAMLFASVAMATDIPETRRPIFQDRAVVQINGNLFIYVGSTLLPTTSAALVEFGVNPIPTIVMTVSSERLMYLPFMPPSDTYWREYGDVTVEKVDHWVAWTIGTPTDLDDSIRELKARAGDDAFRGIFVVPRGSLRNLPKTPLPGSLFLEVGHPTVWQVLSVSGGVVTALHAVADPPELGRITTGNQSNVDWSQVARTPNGSVVRIQTIGDNGGGVITITPIVDLVNRLISGGQVGIADATLILRLALGLVSRG